MANSLHHQHKEINGDDYFSIFIPAIGCSFPCAIHLDALHLTQVSDAWLLERCKPIVAVSPQSKLAAKLFAPDHLVTSAFGVLTVLFFANAISTHRLFPVLKLMNWYFMLDNWVDEPGICGFGPTRSTHIIDNIINIFVPSSHNKAHIDDLPIANCTLSQGTQHPTTLEPAKRSAASVLPEITGSNDDTASLVEGAQFYITQELARILPTTAAEWWSDMCTDMPLSQQVRFCTIFRGYLSCIRDETAFRSICTLPDLNAYLCIRRHTIGWYPLALLTEYTLCMELDQDAITNPLLIALMKNVCEAVIIGNDIISFRKEYERGDHFNIVMVLCYQKLKEGRCDMGSDTSARELPSTWAAQLATPELLQESMNEACEMVTQRDQQCLKGIEKIKRSKELMEKPGMDAFLEAMGNYLAGSLYWSLYSGRYGICAIGNNFNPTPKQLERDMAIGLAPRALHLRRYSA